MGAIVWTVGTLLLMSVSSDHKNIRAFLTHGGLMGTQEAVYCGVPMIGVPLFSDQFQNVERFVRRKVGVLLHHDQLTEETLDAAFDTVLRDPSYMLVIPAHIPSNLDHDRSFF